MARSPSRFLYAHKILFGIALFFFTLFILPFFIWYSYPQVPLSVTVIDKTVAADYREHRSLFWLMLHWKINNPRTGTYYDSQRDYYGFFPDDSTYSLPPALDLKGKDLLYITDTYGVFQYPVDIEEYERILPERHIPITLQYGGLNEAELNEIIRFDSSGGTLIAEFNTIQDPQMRNTDLLHRMEGLFGVRNTGMLGRYYDDLSVAPKWIKSAFEEQQNKDWNFSGEGIIITLERRRYYDYPRVVVLDGSDLEYSPVFIRSTDHWSVRNAEREVPYFYFFEILDVDSSASVAAYFDLHCTSSGKEKLIRDSIPLSFPAVVYSDNGATKFYFAGDFADNDVEMFLTRYWNVELILGKAFSFYYITDQTRFFWRFYLPMMREIFDLALEQRRLRQP